MCKSFRVYNPRQGLRKIKCFSSLIKKIKNAKLVPKFYFRPYLTGSLTSLTIRNNLALPSTIYDL